MKDGAPQTIYLADYQPPSFLIDQTTLTFHLDPTRTRVRSAIRFRPNPESQSRRFFLHGEGLKLRSASIDGTPVQPVILDGGLECEVPDRPFLWEAEVEISPKDNTALEGLYMSNGMYCTQCEAEGFRKITFYPDRPDVLAPFRVRIESDLPVQLSNGNPQTSKANFVEWDDPWPKPAYLFALVAGDLVAVSDSFVTMSGKTVALNIYVRSEDSHKCDFAMDALKRSMTWDENVYGREYDLDVFNIVAVDDFNMGAMENKGLNIFNSSCVLASPQTATDSDYESIEAIIAHEYFHNWTGNRITCRDWFQLCLKEGLTVYRDQQFTGDMRSHAVKRIQDAAFLRSAQFREDSGPLAHPVRPESFVEINNFYTLTVYEKGAEVIGMLKSLVGEAAYYKAVDLYFDRHDGQAVTIEDWLAAFEDTTGRDLTQFKQWYSQAGTPHLTVSDHFENGKYTLEFKQETPATPGQTEKKPQHIPVTVGLLDHAGRELQASTVLEVTKQRQSFEFTNLPERPVPSILRGFSAPVVLTTPLSVADQAVLLAHDTDPFNRWNAAEFLSKRALMDLIQNDTPPEHGYLEGMAAVLRDDASDPAFRALVLRLPSEDVIAHMIASEGGVPDPSAIHLGREALLLQLAQSVQDQLPRLYASMQVDGAYVPDAASSGKRALANQALFLLSRLDGGNTAKRQFAGADNMTQSLSALGCLLTAGKGEEELATFENRWANDRLVMDKWFSLQIARASPERAKTIAERLTAHTAFDWKNPNRFRSVIGALIGNAAGFHDPSGTGYDFVADWLIRLDPFNPQTAARMSSGFSTLKRYDADRQAKMRAALERIAATPDLSRDTDEMVSRILG